MRSICRRFLPLVLLLLANLASGNLRAQTVLTEIHVDPSSTKGDVAAARKALDAGTAIIRIEGGTKKDVQRLLGVTLSDVVATSRTGSTPTNGKAGGEKLKYQGFAVYRDATGALSTFEEYGPTGVAQTHPHDAMDRWVTREKARAAGELASGDAPPTPEAWTKLYATSVSASSGAGSEETQIAVYRLNVNKGDQDFYMVYTTPQVTPTFDTCNGFTYCGWHTINREFWSDGPSGSQLTKHGPTSTVGSSTVGFSIGASVGPTGPGVSAGFSASWSQPDIVTTDQSTETDAHWFENFNSNNAYNYCNPAFGIVQNSARSTFYSVQAAVYSVTRQPGVPVVLPVKDDATFCEYGSNDGGWYYQAFYNTISTSWSLPLSAPVLAVGSPSLTIPAGGSEPLLVSAEIPNSNQGLSWVASASSSQDWLSVSSGGPFSNGQALPIRVAPGTPNGSQGTISIDTSYAYAAPSVENGPIQVTVTVGDPPVVDRAGVLLAGGQNGAALTNSTFYDFQSKEVLAIGPMQTNRYDHTATRLPNGDVLLIGGFTAIAPSNNQGAPVTGTAEIFHLSTLSFTGTGSLAFPRGAHNATLLPDGKVLVTGGVNGEDEGQPVLQAELWDPATGTFSPAGSLDTSEEFVLGRSAVLVQPQGRAPGVLVFGGYLPSGKPVTETSYWSEDTRQFTDGPAMAATQGYFPQPVLDSDGLYEIVGGNPESIYPITGATQVFDPGAFHFVLGKNLQHARVGHTLTALAGGKQLLVTGGDTTTYTPTAEIRQVDGSWNLVSGSRPCPGSSGCMNVVRFSHTATLLPDGTVFIAGGTGESGSALGSTELFDPATDVFTLGVPIPEVFEHTATFVAQTSTKLVVSPSPAAYGQDVTLLATVSSSLQASYVPTGTIAFFEGTTKLGSAKLQNGSATLSLANLAVGNHDLTAQFVGDSLTGASTSPTVREVISSDNSAVLLSSSVNPAGVGQPVRLSATVSSNSGTLTGNVVFKDGGAVLGTVPLSGTGPAVYSTSTLTSGTHAITASYSGDASHAPSTSVALNQVVQEKSTTTTLTATPTSPTFGGAVALVAQITGTAPLTGTVTFYDGTTQLGDRVAVSGRRATLSTTTLAVGAHSLHAAYSGDTTHGPSDSTAVTVIVAQAQPQVTLTSSRNPANAGQPVTFNARIAGPTGAAAPTGSVTFSDGTNPIGQPQTVFNGAANITVPNLPVGTHVIYASYSGDASYTSAASSGLSQVIRGAATTTALTSTPNPSTVGQAVTLRVTVSSAAGTPTGSVGLFDGAVQIGTAPLTNGTATLLVSSLTRGTHSLTAVYAGDSSFGASTSAVVTQTVRRATTTTVLSVSPTAPVVGQLVTLTATVSSATATGNVTFSDGTTVLGSSPVSGGSASLRVATLAAGAHTLIASYAGDDNFLASSSAPVQITVGQRLTPTVGVLSSQNPSVAGQPVTFSVRVSGSGAMPTGTVTLMDGTTVIGAPRLLVSGGASFPAATLAGGTHLITASYSGDAVYSAGVSAVLPQVVSTVIPVTITLTSTPNPSAAGQAVTFTALVAGTDGSLATGSVTISDENNVYGSGTLVRGRALIRTSQMLVGLHEVRATYGGDATHQSATSLPVVQNVIGPGSARSAVRTQTMREME